MARKIGKWILFVCIGLHLSPFGLAAALGHCSVPLKHLNARLVSVPVKIGEAGPFEFLLDTGSETTLIDSELSALLGLKPIDRMILATASGSDVVVRYRASRLAIGEAQLANVELLSAGLPALKQLPGSVRGILGLNALRNFAVKIHWKKLRLDLYAPNEFPTTQRGIRLPMEDATEAIVVTVASDAAPNGRWRLALDSGASHMFIFEDRIPHVSHPAPQTNAWMMTTATGTAPTRGISLATLTIGAKKIRDVEVLPIPAPSHRPDSDYDGLLPCGMFASVLIDFANRAIVFDPD